MWSVRSWKKHGGLELLLIRYLTFFAGVGIDQKTYILLFSFIPIYKYIYDIKKVYLEQKRFKSEAYLHYYAIE